METVDAPIRWDGQSRVSAPAPPRSGEHNREILGWLGYTEAEIDRLSTPRGLISGSCCRASTVRESPVT